MEEHLIYKYDDGGSIPLFSIMTKYTTKYVTKYAIEYST